MYCQPNLSFFRIRINYNLKWQMLNLWFQRIKMNCYKGSQDSILSQMSAAFQSYQINFQVYLFVCVSHNVFHTVFSSIQNVTFVMEYSNNRFLFHLIQHEQRVAITAHRVLQVYCLFSCTLMNFQIILV